MSPVVIDHWTESESIFSEFTVWIVQEQSTVEIKKGKKWFLRGIWILLILLKIKN